MAKQNLKGSKELRIMPCDCLEQTTLLEWVTVLNCADKHAEFLSPSLSLSLSLYTHVTKTEGHDDHVGGELNVSQRSLFDGAVRTSQVVGLAYVSGLLLLLRQRRRRERWPST